VLLFRYDDPFAARRALSSWGVKVLTPDELFAKR
jgi:hypothetical protein